MKSRAQSAVLGVLTIFATALSGSAPAASGVPTTRVLTTTRCSPGCAELVGVYKVRPRHIYLSDDFGGRLTLHWSKRQMRSATGAGSAYAVMAGGRITAHVTVSLGEWANAEFLFMGIHFTHVRSHDVTTGIVRPMRSHYEQLGEIYSESGQPAWLPLDQGG